jgi:hypothetical protein
VQLSTVGFLDATRRVLIGFPIFFQNNVPHGCAHPAHILSREENSGKVESPNTHLGPTC